MYGCASGKRAVGRLEASRAARPLQVEPAGLARLGPQEGPGQFCDFGPQVPGHFVFLRTGAPQEGAAVQGAGERRIWRTLSPSLSLSLPPSLPLSLSFPRSLSLSRPLSRILTFSSCLRSRFGSIPHWEFSILCQ